LAAAGIAGRAWAGDALSCARFRDTLAALV